ncbi:hypothetical protein CVT25_007982 [Psilocybe cyanescens]|uniref:Uncharacterized protein n=1 Tax=Psilocybe cyanescens TaxID=93625 RepID=A0A409XTY6_PSICY|nr:hypothetical protein CVT25_007982 [Psilocybe cyanescens]
MAATICMNSNALDIALMPSFVISVPNLAWGSDDKKNCADVFDDIHYAWNNSSSRADTILSPPVLSSASTPFTSILGLNTDRNAEDERTSLLLDFADDDEQEGDGDEDDLRMHAWCSMLVQSPGGVAGRFTESPASSAPSSLRITASSGVPGVVGAKSLFTTSARNGKRPQTQTEQGQGIGTRHRSRD